VASRSLVGGDSENVQITKRTFVSNYKPWFQDSECLRGHSNRGLLLRQVQNFCCTGETDELPKLRKLREVTWSCVKLRDVSWSCVKLREVTWSCVKSREVTWNCVKLREVVWSYVNDNRTIKAAVVIMVVVVVV
jgi:hypothetical protein